MSILGVPDYFVPYYTLPLVEREDFFEQAVLANTADAEFLTILRMKDCYDNPEYNERCIDLCNHILWTTKNPIWKILCYYHAGVLYHKWVGDFETARKYFRKALDISDSNYEMMIAMASVYQTEEKYSDALVWLHKAASNNAPSLRINPIISDVYMLNNDLDNAIIYGLKVLEEDSTYYEIIPVLGLAYLAKKELKSAKFYFEKMIEIRPNDAYPYFYLGQCYQMDNDFYRALHNYTEATKLKDDFIEAYNNIGTLYFEEEGDYKGAIAYFEKVVEEAEEPLNKKMSIIYLNLGRIYRKVFDYERANYYERMFFQAQGLEQEYDEMQSSSEDNEDDWDELRDISDEEEDFWNDEETPPEQKDEE